MKRRPTAEDVAEMAGTDRVSAEELRRQLPPDEKKRLNEQLVGVEAGHGVKLEKAPELDRPGSPVGRNKSLLDTGGQDQATTDTELRTAVASESMASQGDLTGAEDLGRETWSIANREGSINVTPGEADEMARTAEGTVAAEVIQTSRGVDSSKLPGAEEKINSVLDDQVSDMRVKASADDMVVNLEAAKAVVESAAEGRDEAKRLLTEQGVPESRQEMVLAMADSSEKLANELADRGVEKKPGELLGDAAQVLGGEREPDETSDMVFKEVLSSQPIRRGGPELMKWLESMFSDEGQMLK